MSNPVERIKRFIDARTGMRGLDPNIVHGINTNGEQENLTLPDLRALLADLEMAEKALKEVVAVFDSNPFSICDTVWVTGNRPETLYDHCQDAIAQITKDPRT